MYKPICSYTHTTNVYRVYSMINLYRIYIILCIDILFYIYNDTLRWWTVYVFLVTRRFYNPCLSLQFGLEQCAFDRHPSIYFRDIGGEIFMIYIINCACAVISLLRIHHWAHSLYAIVRRSDKLKFPFYTILLSSCRVLILE